MWVKTRPTTQLVVKVDPSAHTLRPVALGDSEGLKIDIRVAIGSPLAGAVTTFGVISSLKRVIQSPDERLSVVRFVTDAAINPGNWWLARPGRSGDRRTRKSSAPANKRRSFAIRGLVKRVVPDLIEMGTYAHPDGEVRSDSPQLVVLGAGYDVPDRGCVGFGGIESAAAEAGLAAQRRINTRYGTIPVGGDVIVSINDAPILDGSDLIAYLETYTVPGDTVAVKISRNGEMIELPVTLGERIVD